MDPKKCVVMGPHQLLESKCQSWLAELIKYAWLWNETLLPKVNHCDVKTQMSEPVQLCFNPCWMQSLKQWQLCTPKIHPAQPFPVWERSVLGTSKLLQFLLIWHLHRFFFSYSSKATLGGAGDNKWYNRELGTCWRPPGYHNLTLGLEATSVTT